ncbi:LOW QUALITY PROTEIN: hypothetical protein U9M48_000897 [Paspalum notatum var. saurae]|uniref:Reverse transcriptase domain-containing protein n=1 Tax=Paspalum notatum var. saurae TaxID=547442 RepID=A0AAQ3PHF2_PASNO
MLFVVVMDVLNSLFSLADAEGLLSALGPAVIKCRAFLYADDLVIFIRPSRRDVLALHAILEVFAGCTGLCTNLDKCSITPLHCSLEEVALDTLGCRLVQFSCTYLGIPLSYKRVPRSMEQAIVDKVALRIPKWKGNLLSLAGRTVLVKSTLSTIPVHVSIACGLSAWAIHAIDKLRRAFLWSGSDAMPSGKAKVAWLSVCRPVIYGGLGVRWLWFQRSGSQRMRSDLPSSSERLIRDLFRACVDIVLGDGRDNWLGGLALEVVAPNLFAAVPRRFHNRTVVEGLIDRRWIKDIKGHLSVLAVAEYVDVWERLQGVSVSDQPDRFIWRFTPDG